MLYVVNRRATTTPPSLLSLIGASKQERRGRGEERIMRMEGMEEEEVHFLASCPLFLFCPLLLPWLERYEEDSPELSLIVRF